MNYRNLVDILMDRQGKKEGITFINNPSEPYFISYDNIFRKAEYLLYHLQCKGLEPGDQLVFQLRDNIDFVIVFWACLLGKIIPVPITLGTHPDSLLKVYNIWQVLEKPHLITFGKQMEILAEFALAEKNKKLLDIFNIVKTRCIMVEDMKTNKGKGTIHIPRESDTAFIQFSSGSTGFPKGIVLTHKNLLTNINAILRGFEDPPDGIDRYLSWMPLTHDMGLIGFHLTPLTAGWEQALMSPQLFVRWPVLWLQEMGRLKSTLTVSPNFGYKYLLKHFTADANRDFDLSQIRIIVNGAEPISPRLCAQFLETLAPLGLKRTAILPAYGLAEASLAVTITSPHQEVAVVNLDRNSLNIGQKVCIRDNSEAPNVISFVEVGYPVQDCQVKIIDNTGNTCEDYMIGEILIKGDNVTSGYFCNPKATASVMTTDGWLRTGDLGFFREGGLVVTGRSKEVIFANGQTYYPHDLERAAEEVAGIEFEKVSVCGVYKPELQGDEIVTFVVFKKTLKEFLLLAERLKNHIRQKMALEIGPVIPVPRIPKTTSGKIQRLNLKNQYLEREFEPVLEEIAKLQRETMHPGKNLSPTEIKRIVTEIWCDVLKRKKVGENDNFFDIGGNSSAALQVKGKLQQVLGRNIDDVVIFKYSTINQVADFLNSADGGQKIWINQKKHLGQYAMERSRIRANITQKPVSEAGRDNGTSGLEIAVIGMSGRFPGAADIYEFWENLKNGVESIAFFSDEELRECGIDLQMVENPNYVKAKGVLAGIDYFDASFFRYTPLEVEKMDPQTRVLHECSWEALENAGYNPGVYEGLIGVYVGASPNPFWESTWRSPNPSASRQFLDIQLLDKDFMSTRLSYQLNLTGPSFSMYTACSTSLVAVDLACQGLWNGACDLALAGGISVWLPQKSGYLYEEGMLFSRDGHNRSFDEQAGGTVFSDGAGIVVLKRLAEALMHRDHIYGIIKGTAVNNDGARKIGYTAPALQGQAEVIMAALHMAGVSPETIGYVETHGTATTLGDTIEIEALNLAFQTGGNKKGYCPIGTVKSNIGHLNAAAGVAGLIKVLLMLTYRLIPPGLHIHKANPRIDFENSPFYLNTRLKPWESGTHPRRVGVSSFGIGGTNAHIVLEEAPEVFQEKYSFPSRDHRLIVLSAWTGTALEQVTKNLVQYLTGHPEVNLADVAFTLQKGRKSFKYRRILVSSGVEDAVNALSSPGEAWGTDTGKVFNAVAEEKTRPMVFLFPGVGAQYVNMGRDLYEKEPVFREEMDRCFEILKSIRGDDLKGILYPLKEQIGANKSYISIDQPEIAQPLIFIFEYALAKLLMGWSIKPDMMIGYSFGEYVAACLAGVFSLEEGLRLVVSRANLIGQTPEGAMLSVPLPLAELAPMVNEKDNVDIAVDNGASVIVSGEVAAINAFEEKMKSRRYMCMRVSQSRALHSAVMDPLLKPFRQQLEQVTLHRPEIPFISNLTGKKINGNEVEHHDYWCRQLRETVQFATGLRELVKEPRVLFIEIGPGRDLSPLVQRYIADNLEQRVLPLIRETHQKVSDLGYLLGRIGLLWLWGVNINWTGFYSGEKRRRIALPSYPFEGKKYWIEGNPFTGDGRGDFSPQEPFIKKKPDVSDWFYIPVWKETSQPAYTRQQEEMGKKSYWLVLTDAWGIGQWLNQRLQAQNQEVTMVKLGHEFGIEEGESTYRLNPRRKDDYIQLVRELKCKGQLPQRLVHLWSICFPGMRGLTTESVVEAQVQGFYSILYLVQAFQEVNFLEPLYLAVITNNMQAVAGEAYLCPEQSTVLGLLTSIHQENSSILCRSIDIVLPGSEVQLENWADWQKQRLVDQLLGELSVELRTEEQENIVALRDNRRWIPAYEPLPLRRTAAEQRFLRENGVYLVTGGLGGIGLTLAHYLASHAQARLVLTGRSAIPARDQWHQWLSTHPVTDSLSRKIRRIQAIEESGGKVMAMCADVADTTQMQDLVTQTVKTFGRINGVIHAAGIVDEKFFNPVSLMEIGQCETHFRPKIQGLINLQSVLVKQDLDFFLVMSSISAVLGGVGFAAYSAANIFMDHLLQQHNRENNIPWFGVDWDTWQLDESGAGTGNHHTRGERLTMTAAEGIEAFTRILSRGTPGQVVHSLGDLQARIKRYVNFQSTESEEDLKENSSPVPNSREFLSTPYKAPRHQIENEIVEIWKNFLGFDKVGIDDDFIELGGDSLKAISIVTQINRKLNIKIPISVFFEKRTIKGIQEYLNSQKPSIDKTIEPTEKKQFYATTIGQKKLFILNHMEGVDVTSNNFIIITLKGELDRKRFEEVFLILIQRQESLRTSFHAVDGEIVMKINEMADIGFTIEYIELPNKPENELNEFIKNSSMPFDLSHPPLIKVTLVKLEEKRHLMLFDIHHIISDGISLNLFFREFKALYRGEKLPGLKIQCKDFAEWQQKFLKSNECKSMENYWLKRFSGGVPLLEMPIDYPRPKIQSFQGETIRFYLEDQLIPKIKKLEEECGATLYMIVLAALNILLSIYTHQEDITIASPAVGRGHEQLENIVGLFINLIPMRNYPQSHKTFSDFLREVKENAMAAYENQDYPFGKLIEKLGIQKDYSRNPLNDFELVMIINTDAPETGLNELQVIQSEYNGETVMVDIILNVIESAGKVSFSLMYCTTLFKRETMERLINSFKEILGTVAGNKDILLKDIEISTTVGDARSVFNMDVGEFDF